MARRSNSRQQRLPEKPKFQKFNRLPVVKLESLWLASNTSARVIRSNPVAVRCYDIPLTPSLRSLLIGFTFALELDLSWLDKSSSAQTEINEVPTWLAPQLPRTLKFNLDVHTTHRTKVLSRGSAVVTLRVPLSNVLDPQRVALGSFRRTSSPGN